MDILILCVIAAVSFGLAYVGAAVGLVLGQLRLSLLLFFLGAPAAAAATNLAVSGLGALTGSVRHALDGRVSLRVLVLMGVPSAMGGVLGAYLIASLDPQLMKLVIGAMVLFAGLNMLRASKKELPRFRITHRVLVIAEAAVGFVIGVLSGLVGLMLGSLRLPAMIRVLRIDEHVAVGTNMAIGCITAFVGMVTAWVVASPSWVTLAVVAPPTILGGYLGAKLTGRLDKTTLRLFVGWAIVLSGALLLGEVAWSMMRR